MRTLRNNTVDTSAIANCVHVGVVILIAAYVACWGAYLNSDAVYMPTDDITFVHQLVAGYDRSDTHSHTNAGTLSEYGVDAETRLNTKLHVSAPSYISGFSNLASDTSTLLTALFQTVFTDLRDSVVYLYDTLLNMMYEGVRLPSFSTHSFYDTQSVSEDERAYANREVTMPYPCNPAILHLTHLSGEIVTKSKVSRAFFDELYEYFHLHKLLLSSVFRYCDETCRQSNTPQRSFNALLPYKVYRDTGVFSCVQVSSEPDTGKRFEGVGDLKAFVSACAMRRGHSSGVPIYTLNVVETQVFSEAGGSCGESGARLREECIAYLMDSENLKDDLRGDSCAKLFACNDIDVNTVLFLPNLTALVIVNKYDHVEELVEKVIKYWFNPFVREMYDTPRLQPLYNAQLCNVRENTMDYKINKVCNVDMDSSTHHNVATDSITGHSSIGGSNTNSNSVDLTETRREFFDRLTLSRSNRVAEISFNPYLQHQLITNGVSNKQRRAMNADFRQISYLLRNELFNRIDHVTSVKLQTQVLYDQLLTNAYRNTAGSHTDHVPYEKLVEISKTVSRFKSRFPGSLMRHVSNFSPSDMTFVHHQIYNYENSLEKHLNVKTMNNGKSGINNSEKNLTDSEPPTDFEPPAKLSPPKNSKMSKHEIDPIRVLKAINIEDVGGQVSSFLENARDSVSYGVSLQALDYQHEQTAYVDSSTLAAHTVSIASHFIRSFRRFLTLPRDTHEKLLFLFDKDTISETHMLHTADSNAKLFLLKDAAKSYEIAICVKNASIIASPISDDEVLALERKALQDYVYHIDTKLRMLKATNGSLVFPREYRSTINTVLHTICRNVILAFVEISRIKDPHFFHAFFAQNDPLDFPKRGAFAVTHMFKQVLNTLLAALGYIGWNRYENVQTDTDKHANENIHDAYARDDTTGNLIFSLFNVFSTTQMTDHHAATAFAEKEEHVPLRKQRINMKQSLRHLRAAYNDTLQLVNDSKLRYRTYLIPEHAFTLHCSLFGPLVLLAAFIPKLRNRKNRI